MSTRYTPLPPLPSHPDAENELDNAFRLSDDDLDLEGDHTLESTPLTSHTLPTTSYPTAPDVTTTLPGAYDFEREYDFPPPGSPPKPTSQAIPNDFGNSNGLVPSSPIQRFSPPRPSFFRRAVGALLPSHYVRIPTSDSDAPSQSESHPQSLVSRGGGIENDGVFANVMAKPQRSQVIENSNGNTLVVPEDVQKDVPPSYSDAQADAVPPYWETTVHAPATQDRNGHMIVDDLPTGSFWVFACNTFISFFFQFVGFLFTYLLHTSHAAKFGSRAGLGLTLIQFGFYSRQMSLVDPGSDQTSDTVPDAYPTPKTTTTTTVPSLGADDGGIIPVVTPKDWLAFIFMTLGWFLLLSSVIGYWRVKRWENSIRAASTPPTPEEIQHDIDIRRNIATVFGLPFMEDEETAARLAQVREEDARLTRNLRVAGLL